MSLNLAGRLVTSGLYGWTLVVTGERADIADAPARAYANSRGVFIRNARYRLDIGAQPVGHDHAELQRLGHVPPMPQQPRWAP